MYFYLSAGFSEYPKFISGYFASLRASTGRKSLINSFVRTDEASLVK